MAPKFVTFIEFEDGQVFAIEPENQITRIDLNSVWVAPLAKNPIPHHQCWDAWVESEMDF
jgi:hypothetical protein